MDRFITDIIKEYHVLFHKTFAIGAIIAVWVAITGIIRFSIAIYRRAKGIYPPATSQMEDH